MVGGILPLIAKKFKLDPAIMAGPYYYNSGLLSIDNLLYYSICTSWNIEQ